jgi:dTDP-4-dehydrorhamnose 3,5-epimerase
MNVIKTRLPGILLLEPKVFGDHRGYFTESYNRRTFEKAGVRYDLLQDNQSMSAEAGTLRGLHYQLNPMAQTKIVRCLNGAFYDVVVDIRRNSPTYGQWQGFIISAENQRQIVVPRGFAHAVCTIAPYTVVFYKVDNYYSPEHERGLLWNDSKLDIDWPVSNPILSDKDKTWPTLDDIETNFEIEGQA